MLAFALQIYQQHSRLEQGYFRRHIQSDCRLSTQRYMHIVGFGIIELIIIHKKNHISNSFRIDFVL